MVAEDDWERSGRAAELLAGASPSSDDDDEDEDEDEEGEGESATGALPLAAGSSCTWTTAFVGTTPFCLFWRIFALRFSFLRFVRGRPWPGGTQPPGGVARRGLTGIGLGRSAASEAEEEEEEDADVEADDEEADDEAADEEEPASLASSSSLSSSLESLALLLLLLLLSSELTFSAATVGSTAFELVGGA